LNKSLIYRFVKKPNYKFVKKSRNNVENLNKRFKVPLMNIIKEKWVVECLS